MIEELPDMLIIHDAKLKLTRRRQSFEFSPTDAKYYPRGGVSESNGLLYVDVISKDGTFSFVFHNMVRLFTFLLHHASSDDFSDLD